MNNELLVINLAMVMGRRFSKIANRQAMYVVCNLDDKTQNER